MSVIAEVLDYVCDYIGRDVFCDLTNEERNILREATNFEIYSQGGDIDTLLVPATNKFYGYAQVCLHPLDDDRVIRVEKVGVGENW